MMLRKKNQELVKNKHAETSATPQKNPLQNLSDDLMNFYNGRDIAPGRAQSYDRC